MNPTSALKTLNLLILRMPAYAENATISKSTVQKMQGIPRTPTFGLPRFVHEHSEALLPYSTQQSAKRQILGLFFNAECADLFHAME
jgi:hypothetical protein